MNEHGLTQDEQDLLKPIIGQSYGIAESQEKIMSLVQMPECGGFDLTWADALRKAVAKKQPGAYLKLQDEYFNAVKEKGLSYKLCDYVWNTLVAMSRGYSFNLSHTLAYSLVALQEMNLAYKFPIVFWNCACLITDSGGAEEDEDEVIEEVVDIFEPEDFEHYEYIDAPDKKSKLKKKRQRSTDYKKIATALGKMIQSGISIVPPDINVSGYTFSPDVENNRILFGLSGLLNVGEDVIKATIENRPYSSPRDYVVKVKPKKGAMISLIKAGAFDNMMDRKLCMAWYLWETCDKKKKLTLQNMPTLIKHYLLPEDTQERITARRIYEFNRYLKAVCKFSNLYYRLDTRAIDFLTELEYDQFIKQEGTDFILEIKTWDKIYNKWMDVFRTWLTDNKESILQTLNEVIFLEEWQKYAKGTISAWEMEALCFYYHDHELKDLNAGKYGVSNFFDLPEDPEIDHSFVDKRGKIVNIFKLTKICGTCIAKNKDKGHVTLLTPEGVVTVKFRKEYFAMFDKQISELQPDGTKKVMEKSWFTRGSMIMVQGMRSGDMFISKKYASSGGHQLYKITSIDKDGDIKLQDQRYQGGFAEDEGQ